MNLPQVLERLSEKLQSAIRWQTSVNLRQIEAMNLQTCLQQAREIIEGQARKRAGEHWDSVSALGPEELAKVGPERRSYVEQCWQDYLTPEARDYLGV